MQERTIAVVGLDTSHATAFTRLIQSPDPAVRVVEGMRVVKAARFPSAFQSEENQDLRQKEMADLGVEMAPSVAAAIEGVDAILLEINDPALHLTYFEQVVGAGRPIFIDKPLAATVAEGRRICELAAAHNVPVWSSSSLRFLPSLAQARQDLGDKPTVAHSFGALGKAAAGSDLVWYGVHAVEILTTALGTGAQTVRAIDDSRGVIMVVEYGDGRRGIVECIRDFWRYGGRLQTQANVTFFDNAGASPYPLLFKALRDFVVDGLVPVPLTESLEVLAILEAGEKSLASGKVEKIGL